MSALGWVARTVLISGSSTGLIPPPRGAPRRASRRRTPAPPPLIPLDAAGAVVGAGAGASAGGAGLAAADLDLDLGRGRARRGSATSRATSVSSPGTGDSSGPGADWVTSAAAVRVVATSPATYAPVVRPGNQSIGACQSGPRVAVSQAAARYPPLTIPAADLAAEGQPSRRSDGHEGAQRLPGELGTATEEREFHDDGHPDDLRTGPADQARGGLGRPAGGQHVVDDQDPLSRAERVLVHLDGGGSVLEFVALRVGGPGQPALLADRHEARTELAGGGRREDEAACLDPYHLVYRPVPAGQRAHHRLQGRAVSQQRGDVFEHDSRLGVVRDVPDPGGDQVGQRGVRGRFAARQGGYRRRFLPLGRRLAALVRRGCWRGPCRGPPRDVGWPAATGSAAAAVSSTGSSAGWSATLASGSPVARSGSGAGTAVRS